MGDGRTQAVALWRRHLRIDSVRVARFVSCMVQLANCCPAGTACGFFLLRHGTVPHAWRGLVVAYIWDVHPQCGMLFTFPLRLAHNTFFSSGGVFFC